MTPAPETSAPPVEPAGSSLGSAPDASGALDPVVGSSTPPSSAASEQAGRPRTRLQAGIRKPKVITDGRIRYGCFTSTGEPQCVEEALGSKDWKEAIDVEYNALMRNKTWHLVPPKKGSNVIDCKWVFKTKLKADGSLDRYKARLVAKGFK